MSPHYVASRRYRSRHAVRRPRWHSAYVVVACLLLTLASVVAALTWLSLTVLGVSQAAAGQGVLAAPVFTRLEQAYTSMLGLAVRQWLRSARRSGGSHRA